MIPQSLNMKKILLIGNIGVGKSTACANLQSKILNSKISLEKPSENPYLGMFYQELEKNGSGNYNPHSYNTQLKFLELSAEREHEQKKDDSVCWIVERSILDDCHVFAQAHMDEGFMNEEEIKNYLTYFQYLMGTIKKPDVVIYLRADVQKLYERIQKRGRGVESGISKEYLTKLQSLYDGNLVPLTKKDFPGIKFLQYDTEHMDEDDVINNILKDLRKIEGKKGNSENKILIEKENIRNKSNQKSQKTSNGSFIQNQEKKVFGQTPTSNKQSKFL